MSTRRVHQSPTFQAVDGAKERERIALEIRKFKPEAQVSVEHHPHLALGRIIDWNEEKKLFTVEWKKIPEEFKSSSALRTGLRAFFRVETFTLQALFKCELIRRLPDQTYQYRIPLQIFKNQRRAALRVPLQSGRGTLRTPKGIFEILDLSTAGARLRMPLATANRIHQLQSCTLTLGDRIFAPASFGITLTSRNEDSAGCRFQGLPEGARVEIKQFLVEALHEFFKKGSSK